MSEYNYHKQQEMGCLTLAFIFFSICWGIAMVSIIMHPPINLFSLVVLGGVFALYVFLYSPLGRHLLWRSSLFAKIPLLLYLLFCLYLLLHQYPLYSPQAIFTLFTACLYLFSLSPWFKHTLRWFPAVLLVLIIIGGILIEYPMIIQQPFDYVRFLVTLSVLLSLLALLLFFLRGGKVNEGNAVHFEAGQTFIPHEENSTIEKPAIEIHFLGVSFRVFRYGKFTRIAVSTDS